jgi:hypothetical protein
LKEIDITTLTDKQIAVKFVKTVGDDEKTGYLLYILDIADVGNPKLKKFYLNFLTY